MVNGPHINQNIRLFDLIILQVGCKSLFIKVIQAGFNIQVSKILGNMMLNNKLLLLFNLQFIRIQQSFKKPIIDQDIEGSVTYS